MVFVLLLIMLRSRGAIKNSIIGAMLGLYLLAKILEVYDAKIFSLTGCISGHTLKHVVATAAIFTLLKFFKTKQLP